MIQNTILVLDANQRSSLAVVRSLGKHGELRLYSADSTEQSLAGCSKYCSEYIQHPSAHSDPESFIEWLAAFTKSRGVSLLIPCTEITSRLILMHRDQFNDCRVPFADMSVVMRLADKYRLLELASELGVNCPETYYYGTASGLPGTVSFRYPMIVKPALSNLWTGERWLAGKVHAVHGRDELENVLANDVYLKQHPFILQEYIPGTGAGVFALYRHGQAVAYFAHRRIREKPPWGGVSVLSESVAPDPVMQQDAEKLLGAVNWHGAAMVEYRVTPEGIPFLMEINTRFWGSLQLAVDSGVDFPYLLYQVCSGLEPAPVTTYKTGRRLRWLLGDLDNLYLTLKDRRRYSLAQKLKSVVNFVTPHPFRTRHEVDRMEDLRPAWHECKHYLKQVLGKD